MNISMYASLWYQHNLTFKTIVAHINDRPKLKKYDIIELVKIVGLLLLYA